MHFQTKTLCQPKCTCCPLHNSTPHDFIYNDFELYIKVVLAKLVQEGLGYSFMQKVSYEN